MPTPLPRGVVASVGTRTLTLDELRRRVVASSAGSDPCPDGVAPCPAAARALVLRVFQEQVGELTARHHAERTGVRIEARELEAALDSFARGTGFSKAELVAEARKQGLDESAFRQLVEGQLLVTKVWAAGPGRAALQGLRSPEEKRAAMAMTYAAWSKDPSNVRVDVRILGLYVAPGNEQYAADHLRSLASRAASGEDFCKLVSTYATNDHERTTCGSLGPMPPALLQPLVHKTIASLKPLEVAGPLPIDGGVMLIQLVDRPQVPPLDMVEAEIWSATVTRVIAEQQASWFGTLRDEYGGRAELSSADMTALDEAVEQGRSLRSPEERQRSRLLHELVKNMVRQWLSDRAPSP